MKYDEDMRSEYKELFLYVRDLILSHDDQIIEKKNKCQTSYNLHCRCLITLKTTEYGVYLTVAQGAKLEKRFPDEFKLFEGTGKIVRSIKYYSKDDIDVDEFHKIIEETIVINFEKDG